MMRIILCILGPLSIDSWKVHPNKTGLLRDLWPGYGCAVDRKKINM